MTHALGSGAEATLVVRRNGAPARTLTARVEPPPAQPAADSVTVTGRNPLAGATVINLSPAAALAEFRRWNPWFGDLPDAELGPALAVGKPAECRERIVALADRLGLEMPVLDLSGLDFASARETLEALPAGDIR